MVAVGFLVLLIATIFQGSFGICFKKYQPFSWEAFWAVFSIISVLAAILVVDFAKKSKVHVRSSVHDEAENARYR